MRRALLAATLLAGGCDGWPASPPSEPPAAPPAGSVARGESARRTALAPPGPPVDWVLLLRVEERYDIFCTPFHGGRGGGDGAVVAHGFPRPPPIAGATAERSMAAIATNRAGAHPFEDRLPPRDRWAVARFVAALPAAEGAAAPGGGADRTALPGGAGAVPAGGSRVR